MYGLMCDFGINKGMNHNNKITAQKTETKYYQSISSAKVKEKPPDYVKKNRIMGCGGRENSLHLLRMLQQREDGLHLLTSISRRTETPPTKYWVKPQKIIYFGKIN